MWDGSVRDSAVWGREQEGREGAFSLKQEAGSRRGREGVFRPAAGGREQEGKVGGRYT